MRAVKYRPCDNCPFLKNVGYLTGGRARELAENAMNWDGDAFWCHKSLDYDEDDEVPTRGNAQHCAGSAIFSERHGVTTQCLRIAGRFGLYDPDQLKDTSLVYDSLQEMVDGHLANRRSGGG